MKPYHTWIILWLDIFSPCRALVHSISTMKLLHKTGTVSLNRICPYYQFTWKIFFFEFLSKDCYFTPSVDCCRLCLEVPRPLRILTPRCDLWRPSVWTLSFLPTCVIIRVSYAYFISLTIRRYFNIWYFIIRVSEWVSSFLMALQHNIGYIVPYR